MSDTNTFQSLSSLQLDAFYAVAKTGSFSAAAEKIHVTQSALSQRVQKLENELGCTLIIRDKSQLLLTEVGNKLLKYCINKLSLESEFLIESKLLSKSGKGAASSTNQVNGHLRITGFSTFSRSILVPLLSKIQAENPDVSFEVSNAEIRDVFNNLSSGRSDFGFTIEATEKKMFQQHLLGYEENVLIQSPHLSKDKENLYLDHDEFDNTTRDFFRIQNKKLPKDIERNYFDEIYLIIDAVRMGMGRAIAPIHLTKNVDDIEIVSGYKSLYVPVYFTYLKQSYYSKLQKYFINKAQKELSNFFVQNKTK